MKTNVKEQYNAVVIELKGNVMGGEDTKEFNDLFTSLLKKVRRILF